VVARVSSNSETTQDRSLAQHRICPRIGQGIIHVAALIFLCPFVISISCHFPYLLRINIFLILKVYYQSFEPPLTSAPRHMLNPLMYFVTWLVL